MTLIREKLCREVSARSRFHRFLKRLLKRVASGVGSELSHVMGSRAGNRLGILAYHRVTPWTSRHPVPTWNVTPRRFRAQLDGLLRRGYRPWPLRRVLEYSRLGRPIPSKTFVITFDDGYGNVHDNAWPILKEFGVPASVFLATAYLDNPEPFPFDDWRAAGSRRVSPAAWRPLTTAQCREMLEGGLIELGTHTHTHAVFQDRPEALANDLATSLEVLRHRFGLVDATLAFPFGIAGPSQCAAARQAGVLCSLTTESALVEPGSDPFAWGRFGIDESDSAGTIAARLDGWYGLARSAWQRMRLVTRGTEALP
jgi:peptidoglycan/xylan/chitin deacetylase (PgdA/CDA1 family)